MKGENQRENKASEIFLAGGIAGLLSWQAIIYLDVIKSRIQADSLSDPRYRGMMDCIRKSYRQDGPRVFTRGQSRELGRNIIRYLLYYLVFSHNIP